MQIEHKQIVDRGNTVIYINMYTEDNYEFGKENFGKTKASVSVKKKIAEYVREHVNLVQGAIIVIAINGMVVGALSLDKHETVQKEYENSEISQELESAEVEDVNESKIDNNSNEEKSETHSEMELTKVQNSENEKSNVKESQTVAENNVKKEDNTSSANKVESTNKANGTNSVKPPSTSTTSSSKVDTKPNTNKNEESTKDESVKEESTVSKYYIKLNSGGSVQSMELEEYIVGVVAAEMPASFNPEALKAQAIAARTYAVKKTSQGKTLINSTADQVYKTTAQMKNTWGSQYNYYYNRVKSAVDATQGLVLKYSGEYIDAQYSAMTNGKTELPEYVWSFSRPYLQCVSSMWDEQVKNFKVTKSFSYDTVSKSLGQNISKDTSIEVLKRTVSDRVEKIKIGERTYTGVEVRSSLGLRSTDFTIELGDTVNITTKGYGHGVGMSQYGANVAANQGYTYSQILSHYYVGAVISNI